MSDRCRSCRAEVLWAQTVPGGRNMPLDKAEVKSGAAGALVVVGACGKFWAYTPADLAERLAQSQGVSVQRASELVANDYAWHVSHFATCPDADKHRRPR